MGLKQDIQRVELNSTISVKKKKKKKDQKSVRILLKLVDGDKKSKVQGTLAEGHLSNISGFGYIIKARRNGSKLLTSAVTRL